MTSRQHLIIDCLGQIGILILFAWFMSQSSDWKKTLFIFFLVNAIWQFGNALLSYKFFESDRKAIFVWYMGYFLLGIACLWGGLWFLVNLPYISEYIDTLAMSIIPIFQLGVPIILGIGAIFYYILTARDLYNLIYKTI